jgi:NAD(P)-dependent dehydrogenase (short-subunit alcohol dehydrogenase family)
MDQEATTRTLGVIAGEHEILGLVNNAGINHVQRIEDVELTKFDEVIAITLRAAIQCTQSVLPGMRRRGYGRIVNISSRGALGRLGRTSYGAAKAGIIGLTRTWALELAADGITVNVVSPGPVATEMFMRNNVKCEGDLEAFTAGIPMGRLGEPGEIAAAIEFLLSNDASYVTGQVLHVCGGSSVGSGPI